jgi:hypothetical protein
VQLSTTVVAVSNLSFIPAGSACPPDVRKLLGFRQTKPLTYTNLTHHTKSYRAEMAGLAREVEKELGKVGKRVRRGRKGGK